MVQDVSVRQADDRRKAREEARKAAAQGVADRREAMEEARAKSHAGHGTPTPTQEENDLAKVGALDIDSKADDGSGPDRQVVVTRVVAPASKPASYQTRTTGSGSVASTKKD